MFNHKKPFTNRTLRFRLILPAVALCSILAPSCSANNPSLTRNSTITIDSSARYIEIPVVYHPKRFNRAIGLKNHHFITWKGGGAARKALFTTSVPDSTIHDALVAIGATPGNNLTNKTWSERNNRQSSDPDLLVEGTVVHLEFYKDSVAYPPDIFLTDKHNKPFDFRFGGNRSYISVWKSGCIACLQSCPGGKIGNHSYSIRDLADKRSQFSVNRQAPFKEGTIFTLRISLSSADDK